MSDGMLLMTIAVCLIVAAAVLAGVRGALGKNGKKQHQLFQK